MNGVFAVVEGDLLRETNEFARASTAQNELRIQEAADLQAAALAAQAVKREPSALELQHPETGEPMLTRLSKLYKPATRAALLHAVAQQGLAAPHIDDESVALLAQMRRRFDAAGVPLQDVLVRFKNLSVTALVAGQCPPLQAELQRANSRMERVKTVAQRAKPGSRLQKVPILHGISSVLRPGRLTLLLGPPGAGKSTLLRALSGQLKRESRLKVTADELTYNGLTFKQFSVQRTAFYINQNDIHFGELTVRETLDFAARCQASRTRKPAEVLLEEKERQLGISPDPAVAAYMKALGEHHKFATDIAIKALGLEGCAGTLVGNAMIRGVSGGQKKRVTTGELLVGPSNVLFADEISTGLDSATTFEICTRLRALCHLMHGTVVVSLLQPTPETYDCFDDVMLLSGGRLVFHGPREAVLPFFEGLGFSCPLGKGAADFLQEVTTFGEQRLYWTGKPHDYRYVSDRTIEEAYRHTEHGVFYLKELEMPAEAEPDGHGELAEHRYAQSPWVLFKANMRRQVQLFFRNRAFLVIRIGQCVVMGFAVGTLFLQQSRDNVADAQMYMSVLFFSVMTQLVVSFAAPGLLIERLPVYLRQRNAHFYPGWCFALPEMLMQSCLIATEATIWTLMVYFMVGFDLSARILVFWAVMLFAGTCGLSLFMVIAIFSPTITVAAALQNIMYLIFTVASGFIVSPRSLQGGWLGCYYANPAAYFLQALVVNEFESSNWDSPVAEGVGARRGMTEGEYYMQERGYFTGQHWVWLGIFAWGLGSTLLNTIVFCVAANYVRRSPTVAAPSKPGEDGSDGSVEGGSSRNASQRGMASPPGSGKATGDVEVAGQNGAAGASQSSSLPFVPIRLTFKDLRYSVPLPKGYDSKPGGKSSGDPHAGRLLLLKGITGCFRPGVLTALMGSSGAGKTTLMDCLALRKTGGRITGDVRINGHPQRPETFMRVMGYVEQTDVHMPEATVHEALLFSARLRLPASVPAATTDRFVEEVMEVVELGELRDATIGMPGVSGLSVEQRKRLTIAVELVANPSIVFMDEPTSGLDARAAAIVMRAVRRITDGGRTVVCTIHQPSADIFSAFDELLLLKRGGSTIFNGPLGAGASRLQEYFTALPGVTPMPPGANPATWMLDVTTPAVEVATGGDFAEHFEVSALAEAADAQVAELAAPREGEADLKLADLAPASQLVQARELLKRNWQQYARLWRSYTAARMLITIVIAFFFGTVLKGGASGVDTYDGVLNIAGIQYSSVMFIGILNAMMVQSLISLRRTVFYRERAAGTYRVLPFSAAEFLVEVPYLAVQSTVYSLIVYWLVGFQADAGRFFWFLAILFLTLMMWTFFGINNVQITPTLQIANAFTSFVFGIMDLFNGFYRPQPMIPAGWIWLYWLNPISYTLYGLIVGELGNSQQLMVDQSPPITVAQFVRDYFGYKTSFMGYTALVLAAFCAFFFAASTTALARIKWQNR